MTNPKYIFISYKHEEREIAEAYSKLFQDAGFAVLMDINIKASENFSDAIDAMIHQAEHVVVLWSKKSIKSDWVRAEAEEAVRQKKYYGVMVENVNPQKLPLITRSIQYYDITKWKRLTDIETDAHILVDNLREKSGLPEKFETEVIDEKNASENSKQLQIQLEIYHNATLINNIEAFQAYLNQYPVGIFRDAAKKSITTLNEVKQKEKPYWHEKYFSHAWLNTSAAITMAIIALLTLIIYAYVTIFQNGREGDIANKSQKIENTENTNTNQSNNVNSSSEDDSTTTKVKIDLSSFECNILGSAGYRFADHCFPIETTKLESHDSNIIDATPLAGLINLTHLDLEDTQINDAGPLSHLIELTDLNLNNTQISDAKPLSDLKKLYALDLSNTQITDATPLAGLTNLSFLYLDGTQISDATPLSDLAELYWLRLNNTKISNLTPLEGKKNLHILKLTNTEISDAIPLAGLQNLYNLDLSKTQISDITPLQNLIKLKILYLDGTQIGDISPLQYLINLNHLNLSDTQISDITPLQNLINLESLDLNDTQISNATLLENFINLRNLELENTQITDLSPIKKLTNLTYLALPNGDSYGESFSPKAEDQKDVQDFLKTIPN